MSNLSDVMNQKVSIPDKIPNDWSWHVLTDVCKPKQWKTISATEMTKAGFPVFGANGFVGFYSSYNHEFETVAITCRGNTCGTINKIPEKTYITGNSMALNNIEEKVINQNFLYYALSHRSVSDAISGSAQPQITGNNLKYIRFPSPKISEQQRIAKILTSVDEVIEKTQAQIDKLKDLKTGMMQELLSNGIGHTEFKDSPVGRIPAEWEVVSLSELVKQESPICYGILMPGRGVVGGVPVIKVKDIKENQIFESDLLLTSKNIDEKYARSRVKDGDILLTIRGTTGRLAKVTASLNGANITQDSARIRIENSGLSDYIFTYLQGSKAQEQISDHTIGQAVKGINLSEVRKLKIGLPPNKEMKIITASIASLDNTINATLHKLKSTKSIKKALMQDLLTGKVRV